MAHIEKRNRGGRTAWRARYGAPDGRALAQLRQEECNRCRTQIARPHALPDSTAPKATPWMDSGTLDLDRLRRWNLENRPQQPPGRNLVELETEFAEHKSALAVLRDALDNAAQDGLSLQTVRDWLTMQEIAERLQQANRDELAKG